MSLELRNKLYVEYMKDASYIVDSMMQKALYDTLSDLGPMDVLSQLSDEEFMGLWKFLQLVRTSVDFDRGQKRVLAVERK